MKPGSTGMSRAARFAYKQHMNEAKNSRTPKTRSKSKDKRHKTQRHSQLAMNPGTSLTPSISRKTLMKKRSPNNFTCTQNFLSPAKEINRIIQMQQKSAECLKQLIKEQHDSAI